MKLLDNSETEGYANCGYYQLSEIPNSALKVKMDEVINKLVSILKKHGVRRIEIFGSYARGEAKPGSDLDVIVEFEKRKSLLELVGIEQELEDALGIKVDLLTRASISPYLIERIEKESKVVFE